MEPLTIEATYRQTPSGGWTVAVVAPQLGERVVGGPQLRDAFDAALEVGLDAATRLGRTCRMSHEALDDAEGFATAASRAELGSGQPEFPVTVSEPAASPRRAAPAARCPYHGR